MESKIKMLENGRFYARARDLSIMDWLRKTGHLSNCKTFNVFDSSPNQLFESEGALYRKYTGNKKEAWFVHVYPTDHGKRNRRRNEHGTWMSKTTKSEIKSGIGHKFEYTFVPNAIPLPVTVGLREYAFHPNGKNDYSLCIVYEKREHNGANRSISVGGHEQRMLVKHDDPSCSSQESTLVEEQQNVDTDDASKRGCFPTLDNYRGDEETPAIWLPTEKAIYETRGFGDLDFADPKWEF